MEDNWSARQNSVFTKTDALNLSTRDGLSDKIAIIDTNGIVVAQNDAFDEWTRRAGGANFPYSDLGSNYLNLCLNASGAILPEGAQAFDGLRSLLVGAKTMFALEYTLEVAGRQHQYLMSASALRAGFHGAMISHREITVEQRVADILRGDGRILSLASISRSYLPALMRGLALSIHVDHAFLSEVMPSEPGRLRTVAHWAVDHWGRTREYLTEGTPCGRILESGFSCFSTDVQALFPNDAWIQSINAQSYSGVAIQDSKGDLLGHIAVCDSKPMESDVSCEMVLRTAALRAAPELERRRAEEYGYLQSRLISSARDAIIGTDASYHITSWNPAAEEIFGWRASEVLGRTAQEVLLTEFVGTQRDEFLRKLNHLGELRGEFIEHRRDGTPVDIEATAMALRNGDGTTTGYVTVSRDVSERKLAEQRLHEALTAKDQFLSLVSHELRTPITIIMGNAWHLASLEDAPKQEDFIQTGEILYEESVKLNRIIENLLTLARIERGETLPVEPVQLAALMKRLMMSLEPEGYDIDLSAPKEIPVAMASEVAIEQIMRNLISNAKKYGSQGSPISLDIEVLSDELVVSVSNHGSEISPLALPHLFKPFYRADEDSEIPGMGIGLTVCQRLVEAMHGQIWAENSQGGAKFSFTLPVVVEGASAES